jgi:pyruvate/2-oxoglutarate dehydrogenase complex dihydrolipoamide acyltransferase (E2) component
MSRRVALALVAAVLATACGDRGAAPPAKTEAAPAASAPAPPPPTAPPAAPAAAAPAPAKQDLSALRALVGKYPRDVGLFDTEPLHGRLVALLGDRYPVFLANMGTQGPISADDTVLYVIGNKPHAGGDSQAILLIDLAQDLVHVHLLEEREMAELRERDADIAWPPDVQTTIANWQELARDEE